MSAGDRDPLALRACLRIVALASRLVPRRERRVWAAEWEAELRHRFGGGSRLTRTAELRVVRCTLGSIVDAAWLRRQLTADADLVHDAAYGLRLLTRAPGFAAVAVLVLATGIGASTAIASLADALLFRPLPFAEPDRLVTVWERDRATGIGGQDVAPGNAIDWVGRTQSFAPAAAIEPYSLDYTAPGGEPEVLTAARVTAGFFDALGVRALHGRTFAAGEFTKGRDKVVILSYGTWRERFGADAAIVGRTIELDHEPYVVIGVAPPLELRLFEARREPRLYLTKYYEEFEGRVRGSGYWNVLARLAPGVTLAQARAELDSLSARLAREYPTSNRNTVAEIVPVREHLAGSFRPLLPLLLAAAALLLVVSCANAANLILARGLARGREFSVRQALGAGRGRLIRQMLAETLLLSAVAAAIGLVLTTWGLRAVAAIRPIDVAGTDAVSLDARVAAIAVGASLLSAMLAGLAPALQLSRPSAAAALREGGSSAAGRRTRAALVVVEVCLALLLASGAGLLVRSLRAVEREDPGFLPARVYALQVFAWDRNTTPEKRAAFFDQTIGRMRALPGVAAAGAISAMPFIEANINIRSALAIDGQPATVPGEDALVYTTVVAGDYFRAMHIPLERGRLIGRDERANGEPVAVLSRSAARKFWRDRDPMGAKVRIRFGGRPMDFTVVGIVGDARHDALDRPARPELFLPHAQVPFGSMTYVVRTDPASPVTMMTLKQQVWSVDPIQAFYRTATLDELISRTLIGRRFVAFLLAAFGVAAVLLASAGVYGVMSFSTAQRTREFGVRIALGARPADIVRMVLGEGVRLSLAGLAAGAIAGVWFMRLFKGLLYGVTAADPLTFAGAALLLIVLTAASCYLPARRALRADPLQSFRQ